MTRFESFAVGDTVCFERTFTRQDFEHFAELSGDRNPLHHDRSFASDTPFGSPIVPVHLLATPLSRIVGMSLPGEPALYLNHNIRALKPVHFGDTLCYSARISNISQANRVLTLCIVAFRGSEPVLEATVNAQARESEWQGSLELSIHKTNTQRRVLITGARGAVGRCTALALARAGYHLLLTARRQDPEIATLITQLKRYECNPAFIAADLGVPDDRKALNHCIAEFDDLVALVHTACPPVSATPQSLADINYSALHDIAEVMLPKLLKRQHGVMLLLGSAALETHPRGWQHYTAAKAMASSLVAGIEKHYAAYGVRGITLAPGCIDTPFSSNLRPANSEALLPEQVAEIIVEILQTPGSFGQYTAIHPGQHRSGTFKLVTNIPNGKDSQNFYAEDTTANSATNKLNSKQPAQDTAMAFERYVADFLALSDYDELKEAALDVAPNWDSLRHIELIVGIERSFGVRFSTEEIESTKSFLGLKSLFDAKFAKHRY